MFTLSWWNTCFKTCQCNSNLLCSFKVLDKQNSLKPLTRGTADNKTWFDNLVAHFCKTNISLRSLDWYPGDTRDQDVSTHEIGLVLHEYSNRVKGYYTIYFMNIHQSIIHFESRVRWFLKMSQLMPHGRNTHKNEVTRIINLINPSFQQQSLNQSQTSG